MISWKFALDLAQQSSLHFTFLVATHTHLLNSHVLLISWWKTKKFSLKIQVQKVDSKLPKLVPKSLEMGVTQICVQICWVTPGHLPRLGEDAAVDGSRLANAYSTFPRSVCFYGPNLTDIYIFRYCLSKECVGCIEHTGSKDILPDRYCLTPIVGLSLYLVCRSTFLRLFNWKSIKTNMSLYVCHM